jgi:Uma2 family endonuclease
MSGPSPARHREYTIEEYVQLEDYSNTKHEFLDGQIYAMAGGTPEHGMYAANIIRILGVHLQGRRCRVQTSDVRIRVMATGLDTYPDVSVVCGRAELDMADTLAITNPILLVEVLSRSTAKYDRGDKLDHYKQIPSLHEVVLVAHDAPRIEIVRREKDGSWSWHECEKGATARLESVDCELEVAEVFRDPLEP